MPFHAWSPDVYDGSPTPAVAFMASGVKVAAFAGLIRVFVLTFSNYDDTWQPLVYGIAVLSMVVGAALAIVQSNVKRMLAYSSISHAGFILMAVQADSSLGTSAVLFYLAVYTFMVAGSFGVVTLVGRRGDGQHRSTTTGGWAARTPCSPAPSPSCCSRRPVCPSPPASSPSSTPSSPRWMPTPCPSPSSPWCRR